MSLEILGLLLLAALFIIILVGFPITFTLIFLAVVFGYIGIGDRVFHLMTIQFFETMTEPVLAAVALFTFMGYLLENAGLMDRLFRALQLLSGHMKGSLYLAVVITAVLFAAATGIVGASVTIIGLMAAPVMKKSGYNQSLSAGTIAAGGTLGILIPPSVMLVVMGPIMEVSVVRLYAAAVLPGLVLASLYGIYTMIQTHRKPNMGPPLSNEELNVPLGYKLREFFVGIVPVGTLILSTLGTILSGYATPTEGAALGCFGAVLVALAHRRLNISILKDAVFRTAETASMVMLLFAASTSVGAVFSAFGTPKFIGEVLLTLNLPPGVFVLGILLLCFVLGWPLEWVPIVVVVIPIFFPVIKGLGIDMLWFAILVAVTLQTCWLSPPVALSAYYLKGVMPEWDLKLIYAGMIPFLGLQILGVMILFLFPDVVLFLPRLFYGR